MIHDPRSFMDLACPTCDGTQFVPLVRLKFKAGGGLISDPCGWACLTCQVAIDPHDALQAYSLKQKRDELRQLEADLGIIHAT